MSARGLVPQQVHIPFGVGLNQRVDPRAMQVPSLARCLDAAFTEIGGLQTRYPYASIGANIFGGGTVSDCRRIVENGSELLLFTKTGLYSWNPTQSLWFLKGTHLAVKTTEETKFASTDDQIDGDRAELNGVVFYAWTGATNGYVAAQDKATGNVLMTPQALAGNQRQRLVALETRVLLVFHDGVAGTYCLSLDPASPATGLGVASTTVSPSGGGYFDVVKQPGADVAVFAARLSPTTSYRVGTISAAGVVTSSTKVRVCDGAIAVSCPPTGTHVQVLRTDNNTVGPVNVQDILGDYIAISGLADVTTGQVIGQVTERTVNQIAACHRSVVTGAAYRCYAFWSSNEQTSVNPLVPYEFRVETNYVDTAGAIGTQSTLVQHLGVASRAFDYNGQIYVWLAFAEESRFDGAQVEGFRGALQNTYFLYRDDAFLVAKAATHRGGGFSPSRGHLPGITAESATTFSWSGVERRIVPTGGKRFTFGKRAPREITVTFDSNEARRTARIGSTLYITGGEILQYDGEGLTEVGFHIYPWYFLGTEDAAGASLTDGEYAYKVTWRWENARGDLDRSTTATTGLVTIASGPSEVDLSVVPLYFTHKTSTRSAPAVEIWRTLVNPPPDAPFYLVTSKDPAATGDNGYVANAPGSTFVSFTDDLVDAELADAEANPENGGLLEPLAPPPATIIHATADRIFLAGVAGDPHRVWYSRQRQDGEVASFHDALTVDVPRAGGDITAISVRDGVLYVWRETAIYALPGDGFDNLGGGQNFGPSRLVSSDVGCVSMEALGATSEGFVFKSSKGWYALSGAQVQYIGAQICDYDSETVAAVHVLDGKHEIRCLTTARMLVFDTNVQQWAEWTIGDGIHACIWNGTYHYLNSALVKAELTTYTGVTYGMDVETAWIPLGQIQGYGRVWEVKVLGEYRGSHYLRVRLARNWSDTYFQDKRWTVSPTTAGGPLQIKHRPSIQEMQAIKIRITAVDLGTPENPGDDPPSIYPTTEALKLTHLTLELGLERHLARLPAAQTQ